MLASLLFGLAPALRATRQAPGAAVSLGARGVTGDRRRMVLRRVLVVGQMALSVVLLIGAMLFVGTLRNLTGGDLGFSDRNIMVVDLDLRPARVGADARLAYELDIVDRLSTLTGVAGAGAAVITPISGSGWNDAISIDGRQQEGYPCANRVSPGFFDALRIPFVTGRNFDARDRVGATAKAIVNEAFRDRYFGGAGPVGRHFRIDVGPGVPDPSYEIVGVVRNTKYRDLRDELGPLMYLAAAQEPEPSPFLMVLVRAHGDPDGVRPAIADAIKAIHPSIVVSYTVMETQVRNTLLRERLTAALSTGFALLAVVLAAVGLYGLMAYSVARRRNEIGIRVALGATRANIVGMIVRETTWLVVAGVALGVGGAMYGARAVQAMLFGLTGSEPVVLGSGALLLAVVAGLAAIVPASRAARLQPTTALRDQA